ncbi:MAG: class I SAM-dependent methyltransferase [Chloroflexi bacterium]|nr:class I SAM-dependent methyltransferase [Chloroflexota bacterium]
MNKLLLLLISLVYHNPIFGRLFHTTVYCLQRELRDCESVLDLGCGPESPIEYCNVKWSVGVDGYRDYILQSRQQRIHTWYILGNVQDVAFAPKSFDAVVLIEVLEHLDAEVARKVLDDAVVWARKRVIVTTPNGFLPQRALGGNPLQRHRSGWGTAAMRSLGFRVRGLAGLKLFRGENQAGAMEEEGAVLQTVRWRPRALWLVVTELTQIVSYYLPRYSFEIFCTKRVSGVD